ncbi:hypothetical protein AP9108_09030 [Arthrospira sp. PCC 9108]|nr:hypothetical protein AP9108_09030 [Arthrospira sp. PCC 9108]
MRKNQNTLVDQNTAIYQIDKDSVKTKDTHGLSPSEYLAILKRFSNFAGFLDQVVPYLPYPKTSPIYTLKEKLVFASVTDEKDFNLELTYSEIIALKNSIKAILTLIKLGGGVKMPRKVSGAIADDIAALEGHFFNLSDNHVARISLSYQPTLTHFQSGFRVNP